MGDYKRGYDNVDDLIAAGQLEANGQIKENIARREKEGAGNGYEMN